MSRWTGPRSPACQQEAHTGCSGCPGCECHHVDMPPHFRALVRGYAEDAKVRRRIGDKS